MLDLLRPALPPIFYKIDSYQLVATLPLFYPGAFVIDCEWQEEAPFELTTIGIGNDRVVVQIPWASLDNFERVEARFAVEALVQSETIIYHNAEADIRKLVESGFKTRYEDHKGIEDTMLADAVLHSEENHDLGDLNKRCGRLPDYKSLKHVAPREYNAADVVATYIIWEHGLKLRLATDPRAELVYRHMSLPFIPIVIEGEDAGVRVNKPAVLPLAWKYEAKIEQAALLAQAYCGWPINLKSPDQLKTVLYNVEGMPIQRDRPVRWGEAGKATTDKDAIAALRRLRGTEWDAEVPPTLAQAWANIEAGGHPVLEARYLMMGAQQALTHYVKPCLTDDGRVFLDDPTTGVGGCPLAAERIYPRCTQHSQASGRHGYVGPALQQMKGEVAELITPDIGSCWVGHDWSQIEVRILAALAGDQPYLDAFARGDDVHWINTRAVFGPVVGSTELEVLRRRFIKAFVFRLHYRGKPENAGDIPGTKLLGLDVPRLIAASEVYMGGHPAIIECWKQLEAQADAEGVVYTFMGRPRELLSPSKNARHREASNHPMQGGVADVYVTTALRVKAAAPWARLVFGAHDSQWWSVPVERRLEFMLLYAPIVERPFNVGGRVMVFPANYYMKEAA